MSCAGLSRNSAVGRRPGTLIPGRVKGRLSRLFQRDWVTLGGVPKRVLFENPIGRDCSIPVPPSPRTANLASMAPRVYGGSTRLAVAWHQGRDREPRPGGGPVESQPHRIMPMSQLIEGCG